MSNERASSGKSSRPAASTNSARPYTSSASWSDREPAAPGSGRTRSRRSSSPLPRTARRARMRAGGRASPAVRHGSDTCAPSSRCRTNAPRAGRARGPPRRQTVRGRTRAARRGQIGSQQGQVQDELEVEEVVARFHERPGELECAPAEERARLYDMVLTRAHHRLDVERTRLEREELAARRVDKQCAAVHEQRVVVRSEASRARFRTNSKSKK